MECSGWGQGTWKVALVFDGVHDGKLVIKSVPEKIVPDITSHYDRGWAETQKSVDNFKQYVEEGLKRLQIDDVIETLKKILGDASWDFCLAGGADFFIDKAVFNAESDFLCQVNYKFKS